MATPKFPNPTSSVQPRRPAPARSRHPSSRSGMAAGSAAKENAAPSASDAAASAAAASRRPGYAVKSCGVKKRPSRGRLLGRVPLRDITNLIEASSAEVSPAAATELAKPDAVLPAVVRVAPLQDGDAAARYSLRKGFR